MSVHAALTHMAGTSAMARLLVEDGTEYRGRLFGAARSTAGEVGKRMKLEILCDLQIMW